VVRYGSGQDSNPQWTPDGHAIYFLRRYSEAVYSLCSVSPTGSGFRVVVRDFPSGEFAISPSGTQIAYAAGNGVQASSIDGSSQHRIVRFPNFPFGTSLTWSPDGKEIAFVSDSQQLWVAQVSSRAIRRVTPARAHVDSAIWDPTGAVIAYTLMSDFSSNGASSQVWTVRPDGSGARRVTDGHGYWNSTAWSPGGSHLLLGRLDSKLSDDGLAIIDADGSGLQVINKSAQSGFASWRQ
jgi:Tol biopolymer transport system component